MSGRVRYVVVSPVKDEERHIEHTLRSMTTQTCPPARWVIVDDGSTDSTAEIVKRYAAGFPFIHVVAHPGAGRRSPGSAVIRAFEYGLTCLEHEEYDFIVKLDCDLSFDSTYFERLLNFFAEDAALGIASGVYAEASGDDAWQVVPMPSYHAFGACKVVRRECFEDIGGFAAEAGWDTVDEIRAWSKGWRTCHVPELIVRHHKREGSGIGQLRTSRMHGEIFYRTGGDPLFFVLKALHRIAARPILTSAAALAYGYLAAKASRKPLLVTPSEAQVYRRLLRRRLFGSATALRPAAAPAGERS